MLRLLPLLVLVSAALPAAEPPVTPRDRQTENIQEVRDLLSGCKHTRWHEKLVGMGTNVFPVYEAILADPKSDPIEVARIFVVLREVKADRRQFIEHAIRGLADADGGVRWHALRLLERIGTVAEASPVVALLSDGDKMVAYAAAKTLAGIGGPREVTAMDAWLRGASHCDDAHLRHHVKQCRDELQQRLVKARARESS